MCGRFINRFTWRELVELYRITEPYVRPNLKSPAALQLRADAEWHRDPARQGGPAGAGDDALAIGAELVSDGHLRTTYF
jgi:hypothetical protein